MKEQPVPEDQNLAKLYSWVRDIVQNEIHHNWLHGTAKPQRVSIGPPSEIGATDELFYKLMFMYESLLKCIPRIQNGNYRDIIFSAKALKNLLSILFHLFLLA